MLPLEQARRELERRKHGEPEIFVCERHGEYMSTICPNCYGEQQQRVEHESAPLRLANTTEALRARVLVELAERNGH